MLKKVLAKIRIKTPQDLGEFDADFKKKKKKYCIADKTLLDPASLHIQP